MPRMAIDFDLALQLILLCHGQIGVALDWCVGGNLQYDARGRSTSGGDSAALALWAAWRRYADHRYIQAHHVTQLTRAQRTFPGALHSLSLHDSHKELLAPPLALPEPNIVNNVNDVPTFAQLLDQGQIGPGRALILGYSAETGQGGSYRTVQRFFATTLPYLAD